MTQDSPNSETKKKTPNFEDKIDENFRTDMTKEEKKTDTIEDEKEPLTAKELRGWYLLSFACGVYDIAAISLFIPVVLENFAAKSGYQLDYVTPCDTTVKDYKCVVKFGTGYVDTASYSFYILALSVVLQCFLFTSSSSLADHGGSRKTFLLSYSYLGAISTILFACVMRAGKQEDWYWIAGILTILSNCCFGAAYVFLLAYIPIYSRIHPKVLALKETNPSRDKLLEAQEKISTKLSVHMTSIGFIAGLLVIFGGLGIVLGLNQSDSSLQYAVSLCGGWWMIWLTFPLLWLKRHPGPPLPSTENVLLYPYKRTYKTFVSAKKLWQTMKFLIAWFFLSDGINTIGPLAAIFAKEKLGLTDKELIIVAIVVPTCAAIGIYLFYLLEKAFKLNTKSMILINSFLLILVPIYPLLGLSLPFGLVQRFEIWIFCVYFGLSLGSVQAYAQTLFSSLIPKGQENEFFSLYLITAKGSSWMGPLVTAAITNVTHDTRKGFWFIACSLFVSCIIFLTLNVDKGIRDAEDFAKREREKAEVKEVVEERA